MSGLIVPAPLWRRLMAAVYDGLLLLGIWLGATVIEFLVREKLLGLPLNWHWQRLYLFAIGLGFFGWFWVHGGQTLGMRVWRLQVRRLDGTALRWPISALRFSLMLLTWSAVLAPLSLLLPQYAAAPRAQGVALVCSLFALAAAVLMMVESRRRAPCDWAAGTEVVELPKSG